MQRKYQKYLSKIINYQKGASGGGAGAPEINEYKYVLDTSKPKVEIVFPPDEQVEIQRGLDNKMEKINQINDMKYTDPFIFFHKIIAGPKKDTIVKWYINPDNNIIYDKNRKKLGILIRPNKPIDIPAIPKKYDYYNYSFYGIPMHRNLDKPYLNFSVENQKRLNEIINIDDKTKIYNTVLYQDNEQFQILNKIINKNPHIIITHNLVDYYLRWKKNYRLPLNHNEKIDEPVQFNINDNKILMIIHNPLLRGVHTSRDCNRNTLNYISRYGIYSIKITQTDDKPKCTICKKFDQNRLILPCKHLNMCDSCAIDIIFWNLPGDIICNKCNKKIDAFLSIDDEMGLFNSLIFNITMQEHLITQQNKDIIKWILKIDKYNFLIKKISNLDIVINQLSPIYSNKCLIDILVSYKLDTSKFIYNIMKDYIKQLLLENQDCNNLLLLECSQLKNTNDIRPILSQNKLFIDYYDNRGYNALFYTILVGKNYQYVPDLLEKGININAIDYDGNTILHHSIINDDDEIIRELCKHPDIIPFIKNNKREDALYLARDKAYLPLIQATIGTTNEYLLRTTWKGVTQSYIKDLFDEKGYLDEDNSTVNVQNSVPLRLYKNSENITPCSACLTPAERISDCNHIQHDCSSSFMNSDAYFGKGGQIPYWNSQLQTDPDHGHVGNKRCHVCVVCGTTYGGVTGPPDDIRERMPPLEYPYQAQEGGGWIAHHYFECPHQVEIKYYRIYKIVQKFIELQPRRDITYKDAMDQITLAGANIKVSEIDPVELARIVADIKARQSFLPENYKTIFPEGNMTTLYPPNPELKIKHIPNMRNMKDVIDNRLTPSIITYPKKKADDGTETEEYDSPANSIKYMDDDHVEKYIQFRHRQLIVPHEVKVHPIDKSSKSTDETHLSIGTFLEYFNNIITDQAGDHFGKCPFNTTVPPLCKSYIYPDELGIFVTNEIISHDKYIAYKNAFNNAKLLTEYSPIVKKYFLNVPEPAIGDGVDLPAPALAEAEDLAADADDADPPPLEHDGAGGGAGAGAEMAGGSFISRLRDLLRD
jgi:hypothetical protein